MKHATGDRICFLASTLPPCCVQSARHSYALVVQAHLNELHSNNNSDYIEEQQQRRLKLCWSNNITILSIKVKGNESKRMLTERLLYIDCRSRIYIYKVQSELVELAT